MKNWSLASRQQQAARHFLSFFPNSAAGSRSHAAATGIVDFVNEQPNQTIEQFESLVDEVEKLFNEPSSLDISTRAIVVSGNRLLAQGQSEILMAGKSLGVGFLTFLASSLSSVALMQLHSESNETCSDPSNHIMVCFFTAILASIGYFYSNVDVAAIELNRKESHLFDLISDENSSRSLLGTIR